MVTVRLPSCPLACHSHSMVTVHLPSFWSPSMSQSLYGHSTSAIMFPSRSQYICHHSGLLACHSHSMVTVRLPSCPLACHSHSMVTVHLPSFWSPSMSQSLYGHSMSAIMTLPGQGNNIEHSLLILSASNLFYLTLDRKRLDPPTAIHPLFMGESLCRMDGAKVTL